MLNKISLPFAKTSIQSAADPVLARTDRVPPMDNSGSFRFGGAQVIIRRDHSFETHDFV
jgi:hypothetical protein